MGKTAGERFWIVKMKTPWFFAQGEELGAAVGIVAGNLEGVREGMQRGSAYIGVVGTSIITAAFASVVKEAENSK